MSVRYSLFKNPLQMDTLAIVQYLNSIGIKLLPEQIIESNWEKIDSRIVRVPSITTTGRIYLGLIEVIDFYEEKSGIKNLLVKAEQFKKENPNYRINDN